MMNPMTIGQFLLFGIVCMVFGAMLCWRAKKSQFVQHAEHVTIAHTPEVDVATNGGHECMECEEKKAKYCDPRSPPLELGICLCAKCTDLILAEMIGELQNFRKEISYKE